MVEKSSNELMMLPGFTAQNALYEQHGDSHNQTTSRTLPTSQYPSFSPSLLPAAVSTVCFDRCMDKCMSPVRPHPGWLDYCKRTCRRKCRV
jgi:hypothetical protein